MNIPLRLVENGEYELPLGNRFCSKIKQVFPDLKHYTHILAVNLIKQRRLKEKRVEFSKVSILGGHSDYIGFCRVRVDGEEIQILAGVAEMIAEAFKIPYKELAGRTFYVHVK